MKSGKEKAKKVGINEEIKAKIDVAQYQAEMKKKIAERRKDKHDSRYNCFGLVVIT